MHIACFTRPQHLVWRKCMINSKEDFRRYLLEDARSHNVASWRFWYCLKYPTLYFQRLLRHLEYYQNCRGDVFGRTYLALLKIKFSLVSIALGFTIPPNTFGSGLVINHWGTIVVSSSARIGRNCRLNVCVNIGIKDGWAPVIGDNAYLGPGAKLFGHIVLGDNVSVGANAVVNKSFPDGVTVVGIPAVAVRSRVSQAQAGDFEKSQRI